MANPSRDAYAREHGLSAADMRWNVHSNRLRAQRWNWGKATMPVMEGHPVSITFTIKDAKPLESMQRLQQRMWPHQLQFFNLALGTAPEDGKGFYPLRTEW